MHRNYDVPEGLGLAVTIVEDVCDVERDEQEMKSRPNPFCIDEMWRRSANVRKILSHIQVGHKSIIISV